MTVGLPEGLIGVRGVQRQGETIKQEVGEASGHWNWCPWRGDVGPEIPWAEGHNS